MSETELKQKRGRIKGSLTRSRTYIEGISTDTLIDEIELRFEKLNKLWEEFVNVDDALEALSVPSELIDFETNFFATCALYRQAIKRSRSNLNAQNAIPEINIDRAQDVLNDSTRLSLDHFNSTLTRFVEQQRTMWDDFANSSTTHPTETRLPKINIPNFSGDYKEWPTFKDLFTTMVDNRPTLPLVSKFQYLKGLVRGEAASLIKHLPITEENYHEAWGKLQDRYDKKKHILTAYIKSFYDQPSISQPAPPNLRQLVDTSDELIRGVNALGEEAKGRDPWLIYVILSKADPDTRKAWSEESVDNDMPKLQDLIKFLNKRCDALLACDFSSKKTLMKSTSVKALHTQSSSNCIKCGQAHQLFKCTEFKNMDTALRRAFAAKNALCFNCLSAGHPANRCRSSNTCHHCKGHHHSLLHDANTPVKTVQSHQTELTNEDESTTGNQEPQNTCSPTAKPFTNPEREHTTGIESFLSSHTASGVNTSAIPVIPTALVYVNDITGKMQLCRLLIDSGSQASFISEDCAQRLGHSRQPAKILVHGVGSSKSGITNGRIYLTLHSRFDEIKQISIAAYVIPKITSLQPPAYFNTSKFAFVKKFKLADPSFNKPGKIDILLGADYFVHILQDGQYITSKNAPGLQNTMFGYIVAGSVDALPNTTETLCCHADLHLIEKTLRAFWEIEEVTQTRTHYTDEEKFCESLFLETHRVDVETGRYVVRLPLKTTEHILGNTLNSAIARLNSMERKFSRNKWFQEEYHAFMKEYEDLGHLELVPYAVLKSRVEHAYLPHHAVLKPSSSTTKLRVVFDGSVISSSGLSLKKLCVGPKIQRDLFPILISFRSFKVAVVSDIQKMYRQILVNETDRDYQRIIWRYKPEHQLQHYRLKTVTYGTSAAPFLATRALKQVAEEFKDQYPLAARAILNNFYVDDLLGGADDITNAVKLYQELTKALTARGFFLHKWASNSNTFLSAISENNPSSSITIDSQCESLKVLGLKWISSDDFFAIDVNISSKPLPTKRYILSESSKIFDPLGFLAPLTINFKILLQQLWLENYDWDENIREPLTSRWNIMYSNLRNLKNLRIPRWMKTLGDNYELHGFSDASEIAYAAVVYCRRVNDSGEPGTTLIAAKTKVAPVKQISIPRLELNGALLLAKLLLSITASLNKPDLNCFAWTDSKIVLDWLSSHPCNWKTYIANRTSEILTMLPRHAWHHVHSHDNPADLASRGISSEDLLNSTLWWNGPSFLSSDWTSYVHDHCTTINNPSVEMERKPRVLQTLQITVDNDTLMNLFTHFSSLMKILRIIARCLQFTRLKCRLTPGVDSYTNWITSRELETALQICIKWTQSCVFRDEIAALKKKRVLPSSSSIISLAPFLDTQGVLRVGGRLDKSSCSFSTKHPIILPRDHIFVKMLITYLHETYLHVGTNGLLCIIRQKYWILSCRKLVKGHINSCIKCVRQRAEVSQQLMASLPAARTTFTRAFETIGVDYAGPITLLLHRGRGARSCKGYIALFTCLSTRGLHLEVASDLSTDAFLACFKRFISRRGIPSNVYSDNGTNFVGANRKICELYKLIISKHHQGIIINSTAPYGIKWHFNPPSAPHFGGSWEAGVKLVKTHLRRTIGETRLTQEEYATLLAQIEAVLNSRPLTAVTDDIDCYDVLTPGHFLIGKPLVALPEPSLEDRPMTMLTRWKLTQKMYHDFWKRWHREYLVTLQHRSKWRQPKHNLEIGDLVLIKDDNLPPATWALGRVVTLHPGQDKLVRVVTVKTADGTLKRPITKLCKLPVVKDS